MPQVLLLGMVFVTMAILTDSSWALVASTAAVWFKGRGGLGRSGKYLAATIYIALGLAAALAGSKRD